MADTLQHVDSASFEQRLEYIETLLANMKNQNQGNSRTGVLLAGSPGTGKTSFTKQFAILMGMELITIEAPHITEEHIINIPFIVFNPETGQDKEQTEHLDISDYSITLADSSLYTSINAKKKISDSAYLKMVYAAGKDVIKLFEELGGSKTEIPEEIKAVRAKFEVILFLDEYFRQTSQRIRNMLRGILNGKIGHHDIPEKCYVMYASNIHDEGVDDIPSNQEFHTIKFGNPNKEDWFAWLTSKYEKDKKHGLKKEVIDKFHKLLDDEKLNNDDIEADVRTSPRRWEQLLTYINASIPPKDEADAKGLITNVKINFKNYLTGKHADLYKEVIHAVEELIEETSDFRTKESDAHSEAGWRNTLAHQIEQKMKLGESRSYIPIVAGAPGIGKTSQISRIATEENLRYIYIDCSNLDAEDVTGIPLSKKGENGKQAVHFSEPKLYKQIMHDAKEADSHYLQTAKGKEQGKAEYDKQEWKYLIFFDELNRTSTKVFNGIRRVLLEKSFGDGLVLPKGSVIVAAINPHDHGAGELTKHMQDVVDVIDAKADWGATKKYLSNLKLDGVTEPIQKSIYNTIMSFVEKFKTHSTEYGQDQREFHLDLGGSDVYISPREYTALYTDLAHKFQMKMNRLMRKIDPSDHTEAEIQKLEEQARDTVFRSFEAILETILVKHHVDAPEFMNTLKAWFQHDPDAIKFGEGIFFKKAKQESFEDIVKPYFAHSETMHLSDSPEFMNYMRNADPVQLTEEMTNFLKDELQTEIDAVEKGAKQKHKRRKLNDEGIETFADELATELENFFRNMFHAIHKLHLSNEAIDPIRVALRKAMSKALSLHNDNTDIQNELIHNTQRKVLDFLKNEFPNLK